MSILGIKWMKTRESTTTPRYCERDTCVKSNVVRGPGPVVRRCSYHWQGQCLDDPLSTPSTVCRSTSTLSPHPNQFAVSCPIYLHVYTHINIRCISFALHVCVPEHYHCSLMRDLRDVDLHRPATCRRRRVELSIPDVHIPSTAHQWRVPNTYRTNTCLQSHTVKPPLQRLLI